MPGEDGLPFIRRVRSLDADLGGLTPAIAVSGGTTADETFGAGFHLHVAKPFDPNKLLEAIGDFAKSSDEGRATRTLVRSPEGLVLTWAGHVTGADIRAATKAVAELLEAGAPVELVSDLRQVTGFNPAVGHVAEKAIWNVRRKILRVTVLGGPKLARLVSKATGTILGIPCALS